MGSRSVVFLLSLFKVFFPLPKVYFCLKTTLLSYNVILHMYLHFIIDIFNYRLSVSYLKCWDQKDFKFFWILEMLAETVKQPITLHP